MKKVINTAINGAKRYMFGILICSLVTSFFAIHLTKYISYIIDGVIKQTMDLPPYIKRSFFIDSTEGKLFVLVIYMILLVLIISIANYIKNIFNTKFRLTMNKNLKSELLNHATYLKYKEYIKYGKSQILQRIGSDSNSFIEFVSSKYNLILDSIFTLIFSIYEITNLNIIISISIMCIVFIIAIMSIIYFKLTKPIVNKNIELHEKLISTTMNAIYNPKMIKIFNREEKEIENFNKISEKYRKNDKKLIDYLIYYELIASGIRKLKNPIIFLICGLLIVNGKMNIGALVVLMSYSTNLLNYIVQIMYAIEGINEFLVPTNRINNFLKLYEEPKEQKKITLNEISLEFINVTIKINKTEIVSNISFKISKGQTIFLVGNNGAGKSMIIKVLLGFIPYEGTILLGGIDIQTLNKKTLRKCIGVVFQEPYIISDTVKNNIDMFDEFDLNDVEEIAKLCQIHEEIEKFPDKYNELLGDRGTKLSGGQKQRISIARTLIQNNPIIIFDDVLSKIDNITKEKIVNNLKQFNKQKITIYITQELDKIPNDSMVFFLDKGKIVMGKQINLINRNENYNKLISICNNMIGENYG